MSGSSHVALTRRGFGSLALLALTGVRPALAQAYPQRPIRLIVPFPAGGGGDSLARLVTGRVAEILGQSIVIDNRPGAGGNIGSEAAARAEPDGYTLLYGTNGTHAINRSLYARTGFDPVQDFAPVSRLSQIALMLVTNLELPAKAVPEIVAYLKANPGKVNFASAGNGTSSHLAGELFKSITGTDIVHVPYRGGAAAMTDLLGGRVSMMIEVMPNAYAQVQGGKVRGVAVTTVERFPVAPDIPTFREAGVAGMELTAWDGIFAPAGTPPAIVALLNAAIRRALGEPAMRDALLARGAEPVSSTPDELRQFVVAEGEKWAAVVRTSGARID